jgi:hypothetical protein
MQMLNLWHLHPSQEAAVVNLALLFLPTKSQNEYKNWSIYFLISKIWMDLQAVLPTWTSENIGGTNSKVERGKSTCLHYYCFHLVNWKPKLGATRRLARPLNSLESTTSLRTVPIRDLKPYPADLLSPTRTSGVTSPYASRCYQRLSIPRG